MSLSPCVSRFAGGVALALTVALPAAAANNEVLAEQAREVFRTHCAGCHDEKTARAELNVLNSASLIREDRKVVTPGQPGKSELLQLVECGTMPPGTRQKLSKGECKILADWIAGGASDFPPISGETYALTRILLDIRSGMSAKGRDEGRNLADERYVTLNHLAANENAAADLELYRAALTKALNHLSTGPKIVALTPVDPEATVYRIKLSDLGWNWKPYEKSSYNLYDLILLEYPFASALPSSAAAQGVVREYLANQKLLRPLPYVRGDWLASVATQAPLYNDLLRLPPDFSELEEKRAGISSAKASRAALTSSAVVNCDRLIERRSSNDKFLWRTYDLAGKTGLPALLPVAGAVNPAGGEAIFRLPNGLPGYFIADARDMRLDAMSMAHLNQALAKAGGVTNGLSCIVCHDSRLKAVVNEWSDQDKPKAIKDLEALYPDAKPLADLFDKDNGGFSAALAESQKAWPDLREPLGPASTRFFKEVISSLSPEPITLVMVERQRPKPSLWFASLVFAGYGEKLARLERGGLPPALIPAIDAIGQPNIPGKAAPADFSYEVKTVNAKGEPQKVYRPDEVFTIVIQNTGKTDMYFEVVRVSAAGRMYLSVPANKDGEKKPGVLKPNETMKGTAKITALEKGDWPMQKIIVYASDAPFPVGEVLTMGDRLADGNSVADRFVHPIYKIEDGQITPVFNPGRIVKKTIEYETVPPNGK